MSLLSERTVRQVALAEARKILRVSINYLEPRPIPEDEARILDHAMRTWVTPSPALREPEEP